MMIRKVFLTLAASLFLVFGAYAQTGADSVRIKLKTTAGADLSIDGEFSSTNIMTIKVPVGSHKVKIKYGTSFERDYDIVVSQGGKTEFDFPIEGSCSISCAPPAQLVMDGIPQGMTPQTLNVVGTHNIKIYGDEVEYYDMTEELMNAKNEKGEPAYNFGVILNYLFYVPDLEKMMASLPLHIVEKKIPYLDENGRLVKPESPNGYKYENLVLDMIHQLDSCLPYEVVREREFAPIKNKTGVDSVESARALLEKNGVRL